MIFILSPCLPLGIFLKFLENTRFRGMFHNFGPSGFPSSLTGGLWGSPSAACFRLMFHIIRLSGQSDVASDLIVEIRHRGCICIRFQLLGTFSGLWVATFSVSFRGAQNHVVSFSMTVSRFRPVGQSLCFSTFFLNIC